MEHVLHLFGGGCGEHMIWPWLATAGTTASGVWWWLAARVNNNKGDEDVT